MEGHSHSQSPSKSQIANWWRQLRSNPKAASSESLIPRRTGQVGSYSPSKETSDWRIRGLSNVRDDSDFKQYRDQFLENRHGFSGQVFNVSLTESLSVASAEVIVQTELESFGRIPIVVAKCGAYLKQNGLQTSGIFRIAGNSKRIKELQYIFSTPPNYGAKFSHWDEFTVHDVASLLRRYLNHLAEPLIPFSDYESFRKPLEERPRIIKHLQKLASENSINTESQDDDIEPKEIEECEENGEEDITINDLQRQKKHRYKKKLTKDIKGAIKQYEKLFENLSDDSRQLFIYLLDLLGLFAQQADKNLMPGSNLAAIFQPSIISHPDHDMDPREYELSRIVVEFLIDYSYKLLPHLLKLKRKQSESLENSSSNLRINETSQENVKLQVDPVTPTDRVSFSNSDVKLLTRPDPHFLDIPKTRPYSRSMSSANAPSDMITSRSHSKIPFLNKIFVSDTEDEYESSSRPSSPKLRAAGSSNSIRMLQVPSSPAKINKEELTSFGMKTDSEFEDSLQERPSRSIRRESWLKKLRSRSRSSVRE